MGAIIANGLVEIGVNMCTKRKQPTKKNVNPLPH
jgi:hypothetical protein